MKFATNWSLLLVLLFQLLYSSNVNWGKNRWKDIISSDGKGYYAYLPAFFIYDDMHFTFQDSIEKKYYRIEKIAEYRVSAGDGMVNKYFCGTAIAQLPFFLSACSIAKISGQPVDGYSFPFQLMLNLSGIFYCLAGLFFVKKILSQYSLNNALTGLIIIGFGVGTNLFYYSVIEPAMSHVYSFAFISAFILICTRIINNPGKYDYILFCLIISVIILIRPVNGLVIFSIPFIAGSKEKLKMFFSYFFSSLNYLKSAVIILLLLIIQPAIYYYQCGIFFPDSYPGENMLWNRPEIINILFSYRKGFFIYTPICFVALIGLYYLARKDFYRFFSFTLFFFVLSYVLSCWWSWWYGGSFGFRPLIEYYPFFMILLAIAFQQASKKLQIALTSLIVLLIFAGQVQIYQYRYNVIHWDKMDKEHYWRAFMRVDLLGKTNNPNKDLLN
jgi:hypothetical protein